MSGSTLCQGMNLTTGKKVLEPHKRTTQLRSVGVMTVGWPVRIDPATTTPYGGVAIGCTTTYDHAIIGIYAGVGGTGADTTTSGLTGKAATTDDAIEVVLEGPIKVRSRPANTNGTTPGVGPVAAGDPLGYFFADGTFSGVTALVAGSVAKLVAVDANASTVTTTDTIINALILP